MSLVSYAKIHSMKMARFAKYGLARAMASANYKEPCGLFDYASPSSYFNRRNIVEYQLSNSYYGLSSVLRIYSGYRGTVAVGIEHGAYFGSGDTGEIEKYNLPCVVTMWRYRQESLDGKIKRPIIPIGPYIAYANALLDAEEMEAWKKSYGRTLLVIPVHSVERVDLGFDEKAFFSFIEDAKSCFDIQTVLVCLYFTEIANAATYEQKGYKVVCSGYRTDVDFLQRLRTYIELSDYVITNAVGTHIGYSLFLKRPVSLFSQQIDYDYSSRKRKAETNPFGGQSELRSNIELMTSALQGLNSEISESHLVATDPFWGYGLLKSPNELKELFEAAEAVLRRSAFSNKAYDLIWKDADVSRIFERDRD